jgi:anti-sigma regulatory factor (Ser/Thr protein kinase)
LRPEALDGLGLVSALTALSEPLAEQAGVRIERRLARELPPLSREQELVIYRVTQEALTNVVRHAGARRVELSLEAGERAVRLRVADDGRGLTGGAPVAGGIRGMYERALMFGAELTVGNGRLGGARGLPGVAALENGGMTPLKTRILLADDHPVVRRGLRLVLDAEPDLEVVAEAGTGAEAIERAPGGRRGSGDPRHRHAAAHRPPGRA